ncbi:MAG: adenylosuccinate lyase family protein [Actinobacteria bacterium]|nr:adenylosuccinate lyase family protein [Actinomycetota bacterium]
MDESLYRNSNLLDWMYRDVEVERNFSLESTYRTWVQVEIAISMAHCKLGLISPETLTAIQGLEKLPIPNLEKFSSSVVNVGYPIIELLKEMNAQLPEEHRGVLHLGATTQDIMDTALSLQVRQSGRLLLGYMENLGDALALLVDTHRKTLMPGRTHAQQAVPTTFGLKCAVYLSELTRHHQRISRAIEEAGCLSLYGAAGTSAAMEGNHQQIREMVAAHLGLRNPLTPWHASRDRLIEVTSQCASLAVTLVRFAREIIDLSRSEVDEVMEPGGDHKGASSTMPQKRNPVMSEAIIGIGLQAVGQASMMFRAGEVGHERAAGEWQLEWKALPEVLLSTTTAAKIAVGLVQGLEINTVQMQANLDVQQGTIMAEAYMIAFANKIGREEAHDLVTRASKNCVAEKVSLSVALETLAPDIAKQFEVWPLEPAKYLGNGDEVCTSTLQAWEKEKENT